MPERADRAWNREGGVRRDETPVPPDPPAHAAEEERGLAACEDPKGHRDARQIAGQSELLVQEERAEVTEDIEDGAAKGERQKPKPDVPQDPHVIPGLGH